MKADTPKRERSFRKSYDSLDKHQESKLSLKNSKIFTAEEVIPQTTPEMHSVAVNYLKSNYTGIDVQSLLNFK
jgi:hypothetical protein